MLAPGHLPGGDSDSRATLHERHRAERGGEHTIDCVQLIAAWNAELKGVHRLSILVVCKYLVPVPEAFIYDGASHRA